MTIWLGIPAAILLGSIIAGVCFAVAAWGFYNRLKAGDQVQHWLDVTDEALEREIRAPRPWTLPAAKGIDKSRIVPFQTNRRVP